jgi:putative endopeptidase
MKHRMAAALAAVALGVVGVVAQQAKPAMLISGIDVTAFDKSVRPQDDLFRYVNGGWLDKTAIPADKSRYGSFDAISDKAQEDLRTIVEEARKTPGAPGADSRKVGDFYAAFMDEARAEQLGIKPLAQELAAIDAVRTKADLARQLARMMKIDCDTPLGAGPINDFMDPKVNALFVGQAGLGLPDRDYYLKDDAKLAEYRTKYVAMLSSLLKLAGDPAPDKSAADVVALETELAKANWTNVETREFTKMYNPVAASDLAKQFPGFDWGVWATELGVATLPTLVIAQPSYAKAFAGDVNDWPVERWKPYLKASLLRGFAPFLSKPFHDAHFDFYRRTLGGIEQEQPRWKRAVNALNGTMGEALGKVYVSRFFPPEAKARMETLVENLRRAYRESIDQLAWMGPETKREAQQKLAAFRQKIGYPNKWRDYSKLPIDSDDLVGNLMRASRFESEFQLAKAGKPVDPEEWGMTPQTINAYYNPLNNEVVFPAAILQPPFFNMAADDAVNYGAIGAVIGHEMGHGFDDQGRRFDGTGKMRDWWTAADAAEYQKRTVQLVKQTSQWEVLPGLKLNGQLTLGENIGDLTGLTISHRAYQLALGGKPAPVIDGLSGNQRFYMGWAQVWRAKMREDAIRQQTLTNVHPPDMLRGNLPMGNIPEFYTTFDVKPGDTLFIAPADRVKIW